MKVESQKKECVICGKSFMPYKSTSVCCSEECQKIRNSQTMKEWRHTNRNSHKTFEFNCCICGATFVTNKPNKKTCSDECRVIYKKEEAKRKNLLKKAEKENNAKRNCGKALAEFNEEARAMGMTYGQYEKYLRLNGGAK